MWNYFLIIIGMAIVTYLPRLIPLIILPDRPMHYKLRKFFSFIPYTALGALIIPGSMQATPENPIIAIVSLTFAAIFAWFKPSFIIPVLVSVGITLILLSLLTFIAK